MNTPYRKHPYRRHKVLAVVREQRKLPWKLMGGFALAALLMFGIGYVFAVRVLFPPLPEPENGISVPGLTGMTVEQAHEKLRALGLRLTEVTEIEHPSVPAGLIIAQSPLEGQQLRDLAAVRIAISAGPAKIEIPEPVVAPPDSAVDDAALDTVPVPAPDTLPDSVSFNR